MKPKPSDLEYFFLVGIVYLVLELHNHFRRDVHIGSICHSIEVC